MILIKDRHWKYGRGLIRTQLTGKYDTYKGSTQTNVNPSIINKRFSGNMILIKDRH